MDIVLLAIIFFGVYLLVQKPKTGTAEGNPKNKFWDIINKSPFPTVKPSVTTPPTSTPKPTQKPLTFTEMNNLYGPCLRLPVLMYHHIQTQDSAIAKKQTALTVYTNIFQSQMQYLKDKGYNVVTMNDLINFFDSATPVPSKSVLITFDDAYRDFYTDAYPVLSGFGFHATVFVPTGLMQNQDYLMWDEVRSMNGLILFANHTWSHANVRLSTDKMKYEISTADTQLSDRGLNSPKTFAYPYGLDSSQAEEYLTSLDYKVAFTTVPGSTLCKKLRMDLPRVRVGNAPLSNYGF